MQVLSLFDRVSVTAILQLVRDGLRAGAQPGKASHARHPRNQGRASSPDDDGDSTMEDAAAAAAAEPEQTDEALSKGCSAAALSILQGLANVLHGFGLRDQPDLMRLVSEAACQVACCPGLPGRPASPSACSGAE